MDAHASAWFGFVSSSSSPFRHAEASDSPCYRVNVEPMLFPKPISYFSRGWPLKGNIRAFNKRFAEEEFLQEEEGGTSTGATFGGKGENPLGGNTQRQISLGGNRFLALKKKNKEI